MSGALSSQFRQLVLESRKDDGDDIGPTLSCWAKLFVAPRMHRNRRHFGVTARLEGNSSSFFCPFADGMLFVSNSIS